MRISINSGLYSLRNVPAYSWAKLRGIALSLTLGLSLPSFAQPLARGEFQAEAKQDSDLRDSDLQDSGFEFEEDARDPTGSLPSFQPKKELTQDKSRDLLNEDLLQEILKILSSHQITKGKSSLTLSDDSKSKIISAMREMVSKVEPQDLDNARNDQARCNEELLPLAMLIANLAGVEWDESMGQSLCIEVSLFASSLGLFRSSGSKVVELAVAYPLRAIFTAGLIASLTIYARTRDLRVTFLSSLVPLIGVMTLMRQMGMKPGPCARTGGGVCCCGE